MRAIIASPSGKAAVPRQTSMQIQTAAERMNFPRHCFSLFPGQRSAVDRAEVPACAVVRAFLVHAERVPDGGTEDPVIGDVVERDRNAEHGGERDEVGADVAAAERAVVCAPVRHDAVDILERALSREARHEPCGRPGRVGALIENGIDLGRELGSEAFGDLEDGAEAVDQVHAAHRDGHAAAAEEAAGEPSAAEIAVAGGAPSGRLQAGVGIGVRELPERLHGGLAVSFGAAGGVKRGGAGIDEMDEAGVFHVVPGHALDGFRAPERADVGESLRRTGEQVPEQHRRAVQAVVLGRQHERLTKAVPVERRAEHCLHEVAVRHVVGPLALPLESGGDGVVALGFLAEPEFGEARIADHQVACDHCHLHDVRPDPVFLLLRALDFGGVVVLPLDAVRTDPGIGLFEFDGIVDALVHAADDLAHVDRFAAHPEVAFEEIVVHDGAGDAHCHPADREVGLAAHEPDRHGGTRERQDLFADVVRDLRVVGVLHLASVDAERRKPLLRVSRQNCRQIHRAGTLRAVEPPHGFLRERIHVHGLGPVAPARRDGQRGGHVHGGEFLRARRRLVHAADRGVGDHAFDGLAVRVAQRAGDQRGRRFRHVHGLVFEGFADASAAAVDHRTDSNTGKRFDHIKLLL